MSLRMVTRSSPDKAQISGQAPRPKTAQRTSCSTRRVVLGGGLAAAAWGLSGRAGADAPASGGDDLIRFEAAAAPLQLQPPPAEAAAAYAYRGAIPGPLLRVRQGGELKLMFANKLAEPTTLSFPGLRASNAGAGVGGLTQERLRPGASAEIRFIAPDAGFNLYLPHAGVSDPVQQGRGLFGPIIVEEAVKPDVDLDAAIVLSDWNCDANGQIRDDFSDIVAGRGNGRRGSLVFANGAAAPLKLSAAPGARVRLRLGNAATARLAVVAIEGAKTVIVAVDGQPSEPFEPLNNQFPMGPGARFELMVDMPRDLGASVRLVLRADAGEAIARSSPSRRMASRSPRVPSRVASPQIRCCRRKSRSNRRDAATLSLAAADRRRSQSMGRLSSTGRRSRRMRCPGARRPCSRLPTRRRSSRRCGYGGIQRASCIRWTTAGSPIGATPSSSNPAGPRTSPLSPTTLANGRSNWRSPNTARPEWDRGFRSDRPDLEFRGPVQASTL